MATCADIFSGEWEEEEELAASLAQFLAADDQKFQEEVQALCTKGQWSGLLQLFVAKVPVVLETLLSPENEDENAASTVDGIFSVLFNICQKVPAAERTQHWSSLVASVVGKEGSSASSPQTRLQILLDAFNAIPSNAGKALHSVFCAIVDFAAANETVDLLTPQLEHVVRRSESWGLAAKERREMLMKLARALKGAGNVELAFTMIVKFLSLFSDGDQMEAALPLAVEAAVLAIQDPVGHDCAQLLRLPVIGALSKGGKEAQAHRLLEIFGTDKLSAYQEFVKANGSTLAELGLDHQECVNNMRLLSLVKLATESSEIPYSVIAETLQIEKDAVEAWVIRANRVGLVKSRMDQLRELVVVTRTKIRVFNNNDWFMLANQVKSWKESLVGLQTMIRESQEATE